jgi:hypothetical protein
MGILVDIPWFSRGRQSESAIMKSKAQLKVILAVAVIAVGGAAWLAAQSPGVGEGKTVHVLATPT